MKLFHENAIFEMENDNFTVSPFETVRLSGLISPGNHYNSLKSIKENILSNMKLECVCVCVCVGGGGSIHTSIRYDIAS